MGSPVIGVSEQIHPSFQYAEFNLAAAGIIGLDITCFLTLWQAMYFCNSYSTRSAHDGRQSSVLRIGSACRAFANGCNGLNPQSKAAVRNQWLATKN